MRFQCSCAVVLALVSVPVAASESPEASPSLVLSRRFITSELASKVQDVRWADDDSIYLLSLEDGVTRHRLEPGLPSLGTSLPGSHNDSRIQDAQSTLCVSDQVVLSSFLGISNVWRLRAGTEAQVRVVEWPYFLASDIDVHGAEIALLGGRKVFDDSQSRFELGIFRAALGANTQDPRLNHPFDFESPGELAAIFDAMHFGAGSIRFSDKGDLLVVRGFSDEIELFSPSGKLKGRWLLGDLGFDYSGTKRTFEAGGRTTADRYRRFRAAPVVVEEALWVASDPAVLVRHERGGHSDWWLVVLDSIEPRRFRVPLSPSGGNRRVRADGNSQGEMVLVIGSDVGRAAEAPESSEEVFVFTVPLS